MSLENLTVLRLWRHVISSDDIEHGDILAVPGVDALAVVIERSPADDKWKLLVCYIDGPRRGTEHVFNLGKASPTVVYRRL